jgi:cytochrome c oxidase subunit 2
MAIPSRFFVVVFAAATVVTTGIAIPRSAAQTDANTKTIEVSAKKYDFSPAEIRVAKGTHVELKVHSVDDTHGIKLDVYPEGSKDKGAPGLVFDHSDQNGKVLKGADQVLDFVAQTPGTYHFKCAKFCGFGHDKMKGKLIVE